jgi:hypothetical protein
MGESALQRRIRKSLQRDFPDSFWFKVHGGPFQIAGLGDLIGCVSGIFFMLEVKHPDEDHPVSAIQKHRIKEVTIAGGVACVVESVEEALEIVNQHLR